MKYINFIGDATDVTAEINFWLKSNSVTIVSQSHILHSGDNNNTQVKIFVGIFYITPSKS